MEDSHHADLAPIASRASVVDTEIPSILHGSRGGLGYYKRPRTHPDETLLERALYPEDIYKNKTFWADLPLKDRMGFIGEQEAIESKRRWGSTWADCKRDPMLPAIKYWRNYVMPGMGLFTEGYTLFSIGNLKALYVGAWPECWKTFTVCTKVMTQSTDYLQVLGIIIGQVSVGVESDYIGRKFGLCQDAVIMLIGSVLLMSSWGVTLQGWIIMYAVSQLIYGIGVGGEYPMTATLSMERASGENASASDRLHRGRRTVGAFLMQGWGQFVNQGLLMILLLIFNHHGGKPYSQAAAQATFRISFAFIAICILWLLYYRIWRIKTADKQLQQAKSKSNVSGYDVLSLKAAFRHYWHRILATSLGWFCNDWAFYGSKIFATEFIGLLSPGGSVMTTWLWNLLAVGIALVGYYCAFFFVDSRNYGRVRMQLVGFAVNFVIFTIVAFGFRILTGSRAGLHGLQFLYLFSGFWQQFGPNCSTFLVAAEVYPTSIRGSAHGFSAAIGKVGALLPNVIYNYVGNETKFKIACWFHLLGFFVTFFFLPDVTCLDLREQERRWKYIREGRGEDYHGVAVHPRHLSFFENYILRQGRQYDAQLDRQQRIAEWKEVYEREKAHLATEKSNQTSHSDSDLSEDVLNYFRQSDGSHETLLDKKELSIEPQNAQ